MTKETEMKSEADKVEDGIRKAFDWDRVVGVLHGDEEEVAEKIPDRNLEMEKFAEENDADLVHVSINEIDDIAIPYKDKVLIATDMGIAILGSLEPEDLVDMIGNIIKSALVKYGVDVDDGKGSFNMKAAIIAIISACDFIDVETTPHQVLRRYMRLLDAIDGLIAKED